MGEVSFKRTGPIAGISGAGTGLSWAADKLGWNWPPFMIYSFAIICGVVFVVSSLMLTRAGYGGLRQQINNRETVLAGIAAATRRNLIPLMLSVMAVAGVLLLVGAVVGFVLYRNSTDDGGKDTAAPPIIINQNTSSLAEPGAPKQTKPVEPPPLPDNENKLAGRFIKISGLIDDAKSLRTKLEKAGNTVSLSYLPSPSGMPMSRARNFGGAAWREAFAEIQKVSNHAYPDRPFNPQVPELNNPLLKAPDEEKVSGDAN
jgi:hypothetical protein